MISKSVFTHIFIAVILCCTFSCNRDENRLILNSADDIIETDPHIAMKRLREVDKNILSQDDLTYYALLFTEAQIKCGIEVSSDSLIKLAYFAYSKADNYDLKKRSCFYNAQVFYNKSDYQKAMSDVLTTYEISKQHFDYYWIAKSAELIADIFYEVYNYAQAEIYVYEAAENYLKANEISNHRYALCDLATTYLNENKNDLAINLLDSLNNVVCKDVPLDSALCDYVSASRNAALLSLHRYEDIEHTNQAFSENSVSHLLMKSDLLYHEGKDEGIPKLLNKASSLSEDVGQHIRVLYKMYQYSKYSGEYEKATLMADSLLYLQGSVAEDLLKESVSIAQSDFYAHQADSQKERSKNLKNTLIIVSIVFALFLILLFLLYKLKIKAKQAEIESNISTILFLQEQSKSVNAENQLLSHKLDEKSASVKSLKQLLEDRSSTEIKNTLMLEHLFKEKWSTLNMLCNEYFDLGELESTRMLILKNIEKELSKFRSKSNLLHIEDAVNMYMSNIMVLLRNECPFFKESDFTFLSLVFAGLSVRAVCLFTDIKYKHFYLKKSRLSKRILDSNAAHKQLFIDKMK